ncbi:MAG: 30S ribosome-binding factor RbfA [Verrucomicrobia bacterium]|nr:30S ribosome-binding factor RbfA [Verrucomicrobiota bacterium]MBU4290672.1 30S ribosome-binding factor RbfA [Verrucomicrobiota bacterium]MBU4430364.1 30S ribosome-binding factor RbfA [Verrucomicrobiota bacterium]MCG2681151.1 30S ribosome-binding factor RbfA [Kiritimatiellia bacterium]
MSVDRLIRVNALLKREIGSYLFRIMNENQFDLSAVTITRVATSKDLREARVFVSIRDHHGERARMLAILRKHRAEIQAHISATIVLKYTPCLTFEPDTSVEEGDHVLNLIAQLETENPALKEDSFPAT